MPVTSCVLASLDITILIKAFVVAINPNWNVIRLLREGELFLDV